MSEDILDNIKVAVKDGKACEKILTVEVSENDIRQEFEKFYLSVIPKAKIPGFRPGKAPRHIVEMRFKGEANEHVLKNLISDSFKQALTETSLHPLIYPKIEDVQFDEKSLKYAARVEVRPKIKLARVKGLAAKKEKAEVKPQDVDEELKKLQESHAQFKAVEDRPAQMGDFVVADYVCLTEGREVEKRADQWFELKEDEFLKGLSTQLVGVKPGEEKEVQVTFPELPGRQELSEKTATFQVTVKEIKEKVLPPLSDDLAKEVGQFDTLEALKKKTQQDILEGREREKESAFENGLIGELLKQNTFDLPEGLVQKRIEYLVNEAKQRFLQQGFSEEDFEKKKDEMGKEFESEARRQVHLSFLLDEIAVKENITVTPEEMKKKYEQIAERIRQPLDQVEKFYAENEGAQESLMDQMRNEKAIGFIKQFAKQK